MEPQQTVLPRPILGTWDGSVHGIEPGDMISVLFGGDYPLILREVGDGRFKIMGDCYLHGFMDGEA